MVTIGSLSWVAKVEGISDANAQADNLADSMAQAEQKTESANEQLEESEGKMGALTSATSSSTVAMMTNSNIASLLTSSIFFLTSAVTALIGKKLTLAAIITGIVAGLKTISGIVVLAGGYISAMAASVGTLLGYGSACIAWLAAGSAGAIAAAVAIGAFIGLLGVFILEITGVLDWVRALGESLGTDLPAWASEGLLALIGIFAGPLAIIGGFISGFVEGVIEDGLVGGINRGVERAREVLDIFILAWRRTFDRITGWATSFASDISRAMGNVIRDGWNAVVPSQVNIPSITVAGQTIGGQSIDLPQLQSGGIIEQTGMFVGHAGERVLNPAETSRVNEITNVGGGGAGLTIEELIIDIGDQTLDLSTLTRSELQDLAELMTEEFGREIEGIINA